MSGKPTEYVIRRPPILQATAALGIRDAEVARIVGVAPMVVSQWGSGKRPIPLLRHLALIMVVNLRLLLLSHPNYKQPGLSERDESRIKATHRAVGEWYALAYEERGEAPPPHDVWIAAQALVLRSGETVPGVDYDYLSQIDAKVRQGEIRDPRALLDRILAEEERSEA
jgi:hypothetical protein